MSIYYLYKKTHRKTGLQYLGKTTRDNPYTYTGSGIDWVSHLLEHGRDINTEILLKTTSKEKLQHTGRYYSKLWNVVESKDWANRIPETGGGTGWKMDRLAKSTCQHCNEVRASKYIDQHEKYCESNPNREIKTYTKAACQHCANLYPKNVLAQHEKSCYNNPTHTAHHNASRKHVKKECPHCNSLFGIQSRHEQTCYNNPNRIPGHRSGKPATQKIIGCTHCRATGGMTNMKRFHNDNCYMNHTSPKYNPNKKVRRKKP